MINMPSAPHSPRVCLLDHINEPEELLDPNTGLASAELAGQLGNILLGEGVTLRQGNMSNLHNGTWDVNVTYVTMCDI